MKMACLVVEDSRLARKELVTMLESLDQFYMIKEVAKVEEARKYLKANKIDVLFLDIHLPGENGFDLLESLDDLPKVIFTTAYDAYAIKSFEYNAIDYLLKPIKKERLEKAITKLDLKKNSTTTIADAKKQIFVRDGNKCWFVKLIDIRLFESVGNYVKIYFNEHQPVIYRSLNNLESTLDASTFIRINRKHIVNLNFIDRVDGSFNGKLKIVLTTEEVLEASRRQSVKIKEQFSL